MASKRRAAKGRSAKRMAKAVTAPPKPTVYPSGRVAWPTIVQYDLVDLARQPIGVRLDFPPMDGRAFVDVVHDLTLYEQLFAAHLLHDERHTGARPRPVWANPHDNPNKAR